MSGKHTPGPWVARESFYPRHRVIYGQDGHEVCTTPWGIASGGILMGDANARLIASAPCLLRALRGIVEAVDPGVRGDTDLEPYFTGPVAAARLAIAQATGQEVKS